MSKKKRRAAASRRRQPQQKSDSLAIPLLVGVVLIAVIAAAIASLENRRTTPSLASIPTSASLPTASIPYPNVPRLSIEETERRVAAGEAVIIDVRSSLSYQQSHIAGAISVPETEIEARLDELPREVDLVLY